MLAVMQVLALGRIWAQAEPPEHFITYHIRHTLFVSKDTAYRLTKVTDEAGGVGFGRGYTEPDQFSLHGMAEVDLRSGVSAKTVRYVLDQQIDTLFSPYPQRNWPAPYEVRFGREGHEEDPLRAAALIALVLKTAGIYHLDTACAYHVEPLTSLNNDPSCFLVVTLSNWRKGDVAASCQRVSIGTTAVTCEDTTAHARLSPREMKRLRRQLVQFADEDVADRILPGAHCEAKMLAAAGHLLFYHDNSTGQHRIPDAAFTLRNIRCGLPRPGYR